SSQFPHCYTWWGQVPVATYSISFINWTCPSLYNFEGTVVDFVWINAFGCRFWLRFNFYVCFKL
ncbi:MAG: hypothetical protein ACTSO9_08980, partial [Candidatus Helarchaeota archaeon]